MPIYEYECQACGLRKDFLQKISDDPLTDCPECGKPELKKLVSAAAFRLKGGGWYETDFKTGNKKNLAARDDKPADKKADKNEKKAASGNTAGGKSASTTKKDAKS